jgi:hypothetical protein
LGSGPEVDPSTGLTPRDVIVGKDLLDLVGRVAVDSE